MTPAPYTKGITAEIKEDLERNQKVIVEFVKLVHLASFVKLLPKDCKQEFSIGWPCDSANTASVFKTLVHYKKKFSKGIISSWKDYDDKDVSELDFICLHTLITL